MFEVVGASREDVLMKVRLMALLGLGAQATTLSFEDVQVRRLSHCGCFAGSGCSVQFDCNQSRCWCWCC